MEVCPIRAEYEATRGRNDVWTGLEPDVCWFPWSYPLGKDIFLYFKKAKSEKLSRPGVQNRFPGGPPHLREADSAIEYVYWAGKTVRPQHRQKIAERTPEETTGKREMVVKEPDCTMDVCITAARTREKESNLFGLQPEEVSAGSEMQQRDRRRSSRCLRRRDAKRGGLQCHNTTPLVPARQEADAGQVNDLWEERFSMEIDRQIFRVGGSQCRHRTGESLRERESVTRNGGRGSRPWYYRCAAQSRTDRVDGLVRSYRIVCSARRSTSGQTRRRRKRYSCRLKRHGVAKTLGVCQSPPSIWIPEPAASRRKACCFIRGSLSGQGTYCP